MKPGAHVLSILLILTTVGVVMAAERTVNISTRDKLSLVEDVERSFLFDYRAGYLYSFDEGKGKCARFSFQSPQESENLFNTVEIQDSKEVSAVNGVPVVVKKILFGKKALVFRTVTSPVMKRYGVDFSPRSVEYYVRHNNEPASRRLLQVAGNNEHYYEQFPLLRQLDPTGLLKILQGIPLGYREGGDLVLLEFRYLDSGSVEELLPGICRKI
jgi:hypothetical protein